jgi:hypothetical protein
LNVLAHDLAVALRTTFSKTFTTFAATGHEKTEWRVSSLNFPAM